jgi:hypothetical protein
MTSLARWSLALTSSTATFAAALFAAAYSALERNNAAWTRVALPGATDSFARAAPIGVALTAVVLAASAVAAFRRNDTAVVATACAAWLFAFAWVLACLYVWRMPYMLIGERITL